MHRLSLPTANYINSMALLSGSPQARKRVTLALNQTFDRAQLTYTLMVGGRCTLNPGRKRACMAFKRLMKL